MDVDVDVDESIEYEGVRPDRPSTAREWVESSSWNLPSGGASDKKDKRDPLELGASGISVGLVGWYTRAWVVIVFFKTWSNLPK
jgi:hypothetical protein